MARNLAQPLDRLERLAAEFMNTNQGPVYLREGAPVPEAVEPERVVTVKLVFIDPPDMPAEELPESTEPLPTIERPSPPCVKRPLPTSPLGSCKKEAQHLGRAGLLARWWRSLRKGAG
jgi:hypothetical protein